MISDIIVFTIIQHQQNVDMSPYITLMYITTYIVLLYLGGKLNLKCQDMEIFTMK